MNAAGSDIPTRWALVLRAMEAGCIHVARRLATPLVDDSQTIWDALADAAYPHAPDHPSPLVVQGEIPGIPQANARRESA